MWIHEGFGQYAEAVYLEDLFGKSSADKYLNGLKDVLNEVEISNFIKTLKKQNVPRMNIFDGPNKKIYRRYAFNKNMSKQTHKETHQELLAYVENNASEEAYKILLNLNKKYENKYGVWF